MYSSAKRFPAGTVADEYANPAGNAAYSGDYGVHVYLVRETVESIGAVEAQMWVYKHVMTLECQ